jgi:hypothetical protein
MISMQIFDSGVLALVSLVILAIAVTGLMMVAPRHSRAGGTPRGGTRPDISPEPLPNPDDDSFVIPDDASELTGDRELALV